MSTTMAVAMAVVMAAGGFPLGEHAQEKRQTTTGEKTKTMKTRQTIDGDFIYLIKFIINNY